MTDNEPAVAGSSPSDRIIRLVVVEDHALVREGTVQLLEQHADLSVVGQAATGEDAVELIGLIQPDIALIDIELPGIGGLQVARAVAERVPSVRVVILSAYDDYAYVAEALEVGVAGYVLKTVRGRDLVNAVRTVASGGVVFDETVYRRMAAGLNPGAGRARLDLTARESDVLSLLGAGLSNRQIADRLGVGLRTVESHVSNVLAKLGLSRRTEAALYAVKHRVPSSDSRRAAE